jgi:hypothetical protein
MASTATNPKWRKKVNITYEEYFNPPWFIPHKGIVKIAKELEKELGKEKAHQIVSRCADELATSNMSAREGPPKEIMEAWRKLIEPTSPIFAHALETEFIDDTPHTVKMRVKECLWAESFREMGAADIGFLWECKTDYAAATAFHPKLKLWRDKTLMQGDDCCEFCWTWEEDDK